MNEHIAALPPTMPRICDYVRWFAEHRPSDEALVAKGERIDYAGFAREVDVIAKALIATGIRPGDRIAMLDAPGPRFMTMFAAASGIGAIWMGLNPRYQFGELRYVIDDARPRLIVSRARIGERDHAAEFATLERELDETTAILTIDERGDDRLAFDAFLKAGEAVSADQLAAWREAAGGRQPCLLVYTSGSTGQPKGALLHHEGIIAFSLEQARLWRVTPYRCLNYFPINHVGCTVDISVPALVQGGAIVFMAQFDAARSIEMIERERISWLASVPSVYALQMACPGWDAADLTAVQLCIWEGAAIPEDILDRLMARFPLLATNYGMTETTSAMAATAPGRDRDTLLNSVGTPFPGVDLKLIDDQGREVGPGETGEIASKSIYNFAGYWQRPEASAAAFTRDSFFKTGDLGRRRPDGTLAIVGRLKEMFKSGGYNVYPREIEIALESHAAVESAVVVSAPDPVWQEVGVAYVTLTGVADADDLLAWCRERLANYKVPKRLFIETELPLLPIGKVDRRALAERASREDR